MQHPVDQIVAGQLGVHQHQMFMDLLAKLPLGHGLRTPIVSSSACSSGAILCGARLAIDAPALGARLRRRTDQTRRNNGVVLGCTHRTRE